MSSVKPLWLEQHLLEPSWKKRLAPAFQAPCMHALNDFLRGECQKGTIIYPQPSHWFRALNETPFDAVKVVLLGQDPYHGPGQAHGLAFSVPEGVRIPPSLRHVFQELASDLKVPAPQQGCLLKWAQQGVLLLNTVLTVEEGKAGSHQKKGWEFLTDAIIQQINEHKKNVVFLLWGQQALQKAPQIDPKKHAIFQAPHPSPLSAYRGFFGSQPFSKTNAYLQASHQQPIDFHLERLTP